MARFFVDLIESDIISLDGDNARHITKSLRMKIDDLLTLSDGNGYDYNCIIKEINLDNVVVSVVDKLPNSTEPAIEVVLFQCLPKGDKLDFIIQKSVELGITKVVPVLSTYCISRPKPQAFERKLKRLDTISLEAAKQSGRGIVPTVDDLVDYKKALNLMNSYEQSILFYEKATIRLKEHLKKPVKSIAIMVGSEGGFSKDEVQQAERQNISISSLGRRILRCETAPIVALSALMHERNEF